MVRQRQALLLLALSVVPAVIYAQSWDWSFLDRSPPPPARAPNLAAGNPFTGDAFNSLHL
jgi:hypothetical protein